MATRAAWPTHRVGVWVQALGGSPGSPALLSCPLQCPSDVAFGACLSLCSAFWLTWPLPVPGSAFWVF